ncbi:hypothetical protein [Chitinophaga sp. YR573]|uniref:hypothetical protein n=1 Tax=Chitinophaga sp. YR573 TaxID=1881040 RepID=UPI000B7DA6F2|nr:hypothetical protein [Chitinophaga sp. YR573]
MKIYLILMFSIGACVNKPSAASFETGKVIDTVICKNDATQSYALYVPSKGNKEVLPVIYLFDPHADGKLPLNKYKSLADTYGYILVGSNNSKNGNDWSATENIWNNLSADVQSRLKIDSNRIYTGGFSGGAKVAGYIALKYPVIKGVIVNGAGMPDGTSPADFNFSYTAIAGEGDLNLTDIVAFSKALVNTQTRQHLIFFDGKHEWAPDSTMNLAFAGLQLDAMQKNIIPKNEKFINDYIEKSKERLDTFYHAKKMIKAVQECTLSISFLDGLTDKATRFHENLTSLTNDPLYKTQDKMQEQLLSVEQNTKVTYSQHFEQADMPYWVKTIDHLKAGATAKTTESPMYQRLLAYLSLAFYSYSNHFITGNANPEARYFVELYKLADATNSEAWYFSAILDAREGRSDTEKDLLKAVENGFRDKNRLKQQSEFQGIPDLTSIENKMN